MEGYHKSVLLKEAIDALISTRPSQDGLASAGRVWYLDCTLGDGGHALEIVKRGGKVIGIDVDPQAHTRVQKRFNDLDIDKSDYRLVVGNFRDIKNLITQQMDTDGLRIAGAIFDLGVSSLQLETPQRGFSFGKEGPLDMRMDPSLQVQALDLINALTRKELNELFKRLGEEKYSWRLADTLVSACEVGRIKTTKDLAELVENSVGRKRGKIHPATRVFQALRMTVNDELGALPEGLDQAKELVEKNGRIVVVSFHSLEDRIVKNAFREWQDLGLGEVLNKKPLVPSEGEVALNPRSRSAKMRVFLIK